MNTLYSGRFTGDVDASVKRLNDSLPFDQILWPHDIEGSIAHATMLGECGIIPREESIEIVEGLKGIEAALQAGELQLPQDAEDVHTAVELLLRERIGPVAGKLHTARSRNDQVATDTRLFLRQAIDHLVKSLSSFQEVLCGAAEREMGTIMPGYTHMQHAQPVLLAHHLLAYFWMFERDRERLLDCRKRVNVLPLGSAALAGTSFSINRDRVGELLGFDSVTQNSLDAVSDRDYIVEFLAAGSLVAMHLSRLAEELILWNSPAFGFVDLDDSVTTGSSIMPQKKNPDVAELARGKTGRVFGHLMAMLTVMKGLPLAYNKDTQEDKEPLFDTVETLELLLPAFERMLSAAKFNGAKMASALKGDFSTATDLADWLVRQGTPFRDAHEKVAGLVRSCIQRGIGLEDLSAEELGAALGGVPEVSPEASVASRTSAGGTAPEAVRIQLELAKKALARSYSK